MLYDIITDKFADETNKQKKQSVGKQLPPYNPACL